MNLSRRRIVKYVRGNLIVFVVFFGVFTLTFYANVIFVDLENETGEDEKNGEVKRRNGMKRFFYFLFIIFEAIK